MMLFLSSLFVVRLDDIASDCGSELELETDAP